MTRIAILQHERQRVDNMLLIHGISDYWRRKGLKVDFYNGLKKKIKADILIPQVDLTITPTPYREAIDSFKGLVLNRNIFDISKRKISANLAEPGYEGAVIVKPNLNSNGDPELRLKSKLEKGIHLIKKQLGLIQKGYQVFASYKEVPGIFKASNHYVVEKFLPQRDGDDYIVHLTAFLGDQHKTERIRSKEPVIKGHYTKSTRITVPTPIDVLQLKENMGFDYGKFDFSIYNGQIELFDANSTPGGARPELIRSYMEDLGKGIYYYLKRL
ncbi:MAG: hypothetical protein RIC80_04415 [Cyclobacteriaceae bacterium]